jgi:hypothetical protein
MAKRRALASGARICGRERVGRAKPAVVSALRRPRGAARWRWCAAGRNAPTATPHALELRRDYNDHELGNGIDENSRSIRYDHVSRARTRARGRANVPATAEDGAAHDASGLSVDPRALGLAHHRMAMDRRL